MVILRVGFATLFGERISIVHEIGIALEIGMRLERLSRGEGLDPRVAVGTEQDADGDIQFLVKGVSK